MDLRGKLSQVWVGGIVGAVLAVLCGLLLRCTPLGAGLIEFSYDLPFSLRPNISTEDVAIIYMDEISHKDLKQPYELPWDRALHAQLLQILKTNQVKGVVFDVLFDGPSGNDASDKALAKAMKDFGRVVIGADFEAIEHPGVERSWQILYPYKLLMEAAAGHGLVKLPQSPDFAIRRHFIEPLDLPDPIPNLSWRCAEVIKADVAKEPKKRRLSKWINYYGPPGFLPNVSYSQALIPEGVPPGYFKDKVVFVGAKLSADFTGKGKDEFKTPYRWQASFSPGVEIHAIKFLNLLRQNWLTRAPLMVELLLVLVVGLLAGYGLVLCRPLAAVGLALVAAALFLATGLFLVWRQYAWFAWVIGVHQVAVAGAWSVVFNAIRYYYEKLLAEAETRREQAEKEREKAEKEREKAEKEAERAEKERALAEQKRLEAEKERLEAEQKLLEEQKRVLRESLVLHISPGRAEEILKHPELLAPVTKRQTISILFSDIEAYSKLSEMLELEDLAGKLNNYYEIALSCVHATDGTVIKLIGDAIFAIWNAPFAQEDHCVRACRAALIMSDKLQAHDASHRGPPLRTRFGLHTGDASVGNIGSTKRFDYTAVGHSVNVASRLEGLNKMLGTRLLATQDIKAQVNHSIRTRPMGFFRFKGINRIQEVHELVALAEQMPQLPPWMETFDLAIQHFWRRDWNQAEQGFRRTIELHPDDGPAQFYLDRIKEFRRKPPGGDWMGEIILTEK